MRFQDLDQRGTRAAQPAATAVPVATRYYVTDEQVTERSNGTDWEDVSDGGDGGAAGALVLLESHTAAASATLDFTTRNAAGQSGATFQADFDEYLIEFVNVVPATTAVDFYLRLSTDGGATYDATAVYAVTGFVQNHASSASFGNSPAVLATEIAFRSGAEISNNSGWGIVGSGRLFSPRSTTLYKRVHADVSYVTGTPLIQNVRLAAVYASLTAVNALRCYFSSGNIASGTIRIYGVAK